MTKRPFTGYADQEQGFWSRHHDKYSESILAVGRGNTSVEVNEREYREARAQFEQMVSEDFPEPAQLSVLDCGFGHGHYARACKDLGVGRYVGLDFASPKRLDLGPTYEFRQQDLGAPFDLGETFGLVICLDVIFHIVNDAKFETALKNLRSHATDKVYITSLFRAAVFPPYVKHRPLTAYASLQAKHLSTASWRDNSIARFEVAQ